MKACLFVTIIAALAVEPTEGSASASNWASNGTPVALGGGIKFGINAIPNGVGGFYATWVDPRNGILGMEHDVYVQSLLPSGMPPSGWPINGAPVLVHERDQRSYSLALNSDGGVLVGWLDQRFDGGDGYLQRMDADGLRHAGWPESGVAAVTGPGDQGLIEMCSDGSGGAYLSWIAGEASPVQPRVKHVLPSGLIDPDWPSNGVALPVPRDAGSTYAAAEYWAKLASDGSGGCYVSWYVYQADATGIAESEVYLQRLTSAGVPAAGWPDSGLVLADTRWSRFITDMFADETGHVFVVWLDARVDGSYPDIYAQRVSPEGVIAPGWTATNGHPVTTAPWLQQQATFCTDGAGGFIAAWYDQRAFDYAQVYAVRILADGSVAPGWTPGGKLVSSPFTLGLSPRVAPDGMGGAFISWHTEDWRGFVQHLLSDGSVAPGWHAYGFGLPVDGGAQQELRLVSDEQGGAYVLWEDDRPGDGFSTDIYAMKLAGDGPVATQLALVSADATVERVSLRWQGEGAFGPVTLERRGEGDEWVSIANLTSDGAGAYSHEDRDIVPGARYAYRLAWGAHSRTDVTWITVPRSLALSLDGARPNPARGALQVAFTLPDDSPAMLDVLDVSGRRVANHEVGSRGPGQHVLRLNDAIDPGIYWLRLEQGGQSLSVRAVLLD
jgi:hypothetical protein